MFFLYICMCARVCLRIIQYTGTIPLCRKNARTIQIDEIVVYSVHCQKYYSVKSKLSLSSDQQLNFLAFIVLFALGCTNSFPPNSFTLFLFACQSFYTIDTNVYINRYIKCMLLPKPKKLAHRCFIEIDSHVYFATFPLRCRKSLFESVIFVSLLFIPSIEHKNAETKHKQYVRMLFAHM